MLLRILPFLLIPLCGYGQSNANGEMLNVGNTRSEKKPIEIIRSSRFNLEELKVRWKKAALESCPGVPCVSIAVPGSPTSVTAVAGNAQVTVSFTAPVSNGGSAITIYTVTSSPGGITNTGSGSPITVSGLTNGTNYTFTVVATNSIGNSVPSAASSVVTPVVPTIPGAPTGVTAVAGNALALVSFTAPVSNGGSAITIYTVTSSPGGITNTGSGSPITVSGLTNGTNYTFTVVATNAIGNSTPSTPSSAVKPTSVPGAPTSVSATVGNGQATVSFSAPASNGGGSITGYSVTSNPGGITNTGPSSPITVSGLINGIPYTFTVIATNSAGSSVPSTASSAVTPAAVCNTSNISDVDGNIYNTVAIGTQCWTKENLRVTTYNDSITPITFDNSGGSLGTSSTWQNLVIGAYSIQANETSSGSNATTYGFLYNWYAAKGIITVGGSPTNNICPLGWHVPTDLDWTTLTTNLGGGLSAGGKMKSTGDNTAGTGLWTSPNAGADNSSDFSAHPGGARDANGNFYGISDYANFWSSDQFDGLNAWLRYLDSANGIVNVTSYLKKAGLSIRCLKD